MLEEIENKFSLVVRKPQEGKTGICISSISNDKSRNIHIVLTMNTLASGMQFFGRMQTEIGTSKIVVFNSQKKTAGECHYAKDIGEVFQLIETVKVIVCCAHTRRIKNSLPSLFEMASDSMKLSRLGIKFILHIDEAHKYIPENIEFIRQFNLSPVVSEIIGYTATPDGIWKSSHDELFHRILIRDVERELGIMRSRHYFGVKDCRYFTFDEKNCGELEQLDACIQPDIFKLADSKMTSGTWYGNNWSFDSGNELLMFGFLDFILPTLNISPDRFSYHFAPAYTRKVSHYQNMKIILKHYPTANVIVLNGNGYELFRIHSGKYTKQQTGERIRQQAASLHNEEERQRETELLLEPSYMIQKLIQNTPDFPTFVTGFQCVGMSVTFINPQIGNFDTVIMCHQHYTRDKLYQLCRFLFNHDRWTSESRASIKQTEFYSLTSYVIDTCLEYETHIERVNDFAGKVCTLREICNLSPEDPSEQEMRKRAFDAVEVKNGQCKKFKVYEGNEEEEWERAQKFYESILGKRISGKSMPQHHEGFYRSTDRDTLAVQSASVYSKLSTEKWSARFQLKEDCFSYARVFVGYDSLDNPTEYTIFVKFVELVENDASRDYLSKYKKK